MGEYKRLRAYIFDFFPEPKYSSQDIRDWAKDNVPAWKKMGGGEKEKIVEDWENFIAPQVETWFTRMSKGFGKRIRRFLGRDY